MVDRVHGEVEIAEPVILELILGQSMQRLKGIDQAGYLEPFIPGYKFSRFEHSVGVYLLLRKYGASLPEQIAGLIHDVSHTAFSHCIDYVFSADGAQQDFQDNAFRDFVLYSEIPEILRKYAVDIEFILDENNFPLKEKELPDLCADRIDYSLRTARLLDDYHADDIADLLAHLKVQKGDWVFDDEKHARTFSELFKFVNTKYFAGIESAVMFQAVSDYLRHALAREYISKDDIFSTDDLVLAKIRPHHEADPELSHLFDRMSNKIPYVSDPSDYLGKVVCKARTVDPLVFIEGTRVRLSSVDPVWKATLAQELKNKEYFIRFES